jgi:hypothetical protein
MRPVYGVADAIARFGGRFIAQCGPNAFQLKVLHALTVCRTAHLGGHQDACTGCGAVRYSYNSCRNRHCPKCQGQKQAIWADDLIKRTLPVKHYHMVFTVPHGLNGACLLDGKWFYDNLFAAVWDTLRTFGYSRFGVEGGAVCVLHTWGQNLGLHPHIHCIVPAAGITLKGAAKRIGKQGKYLYPVKQLGPVFRGKLLQRLEMKPTPKAPVGEYMPALAAARKLPWVVFCEPSMGKPEHVIKYLGQYTHRVAISDHRITGIDESHVTFMHKDYADNARQKPIRLDGVEFLRRFCMHILPHGFVKIRRYGIYSSRYTALAPKAPPVALPVLAETKQQRVARITGFDVHLCPACKNGTMVHIAVIPRVRSPSGLFVFKETIVV